jgi:hypothetical protein
LKECYETEEQHWKQQKEEELEGDKLAAKLESEDPVTNHGLCQKRTLRKRKEKSISIQPINSSMPNSIDFQFYRVIFSCFHLR